MLSLVETIQHAPHRFGFLEALRRLQREDTARPPIGCSVRPADDALRLGQLPSLAFAASTLAGVDVRDGKPPRLNVHALGLFGPNGPLPGHLTEYAHERLHHAGDATFARFADVFHHRMLSLFFRAWALSQPAVDMERPEDSRYANQIGSLIGIGRSALQERDALPDAARLHHAGNLARSVRNPEGLHAIVSDLFGLPVEIEEFVGEWIEIPEAARCRLGVAEDTGRLGVNAVAGQRSWSAQHKFRLRAGPMGWAEYCAFLPGATALDRLHACVREWFGDELEWELEIVLAREQVPAMRLGEAQQLGWSTWLGARSDESDARDLRLSPTRVGAM